MELGSLNDAQDGEQSGVGFEEISIIFATLGTFFFGTEPLNRI